MNDERFNSFSKPEAIALPIPSSFRSLPALPKPNLIRLQEAQKLEGSLIKQTSILPGTYSEFDDVKPLIDAHEQMWKILEAELLEFDNLALCKQLYQKLEIFLGHMSKDKYYSSADQILTGNTSGAEKRIDVWRGITPFTEGIKFLLEMAVKYCGDRGRTSENSRLDYLIWLASRIVGLDEHLERIHDNIIPYEIIVAPDFTIHGGITNTAKAAIDNFVDAEKSHAVQAQLDFADELKMGNRPEVTEDDFRALPGMTILDGALVEELGYGIFDWLNYFKGCMSLFGENDFLKIIGVPRFKRHLRDMVGLESDKVELILKDHALSQAVVKDLTHDDLMPMENYKRDSRFLRRPVLEICHGNARIALIGIETLGVGAQIFVDSVEYGTLRIPRMRQNGPVKSAMGIFQAQIGEPFKDGIASKCVALGFRAEKEWPIPQKDKVQNPVGPIDILVIDDKNKRFVLVEAKNLQSQGIIPKEMKGQIARFLEDKEGNDQAFLRVLKNKEQAFASNKEWHLHQLKMNASEDYSVESVIVVFRPVLWPLFAFEPLPILDDLEFYNRLQSGQHFLTTPGS
jgi:hypothetical protein